jgi:hypothetical protein
VHLQSEREWGGTRKDPSFSSDFGAQVRLRNRRRMWQKHGVFIRRYRVAAKPAP